MAQANEKPGKTHDKLIKELNRLKTDLNNEGDIDTDLTKRQLRSRMLLVPTPRALSPRHMFSVDITGLDSNIPQTEQDPSSPRFNSFKNEGSHKDVKGHRAKVMKINKTNKKPSPLLNLLILVSTNWKLKRINFKGEKIEISIIRTIKTW